MPLALEKSDLDYSSAAYAPSYSHRGTSNDKLLQSEEVATPRVVVSPDHRFQQANISHLATQAHAARVSQHEYEALSRERQLLLDKLFDETITKKEERRLTMVRWSLDTLDAARDGHILAGLEDAVLRQMHLDDELERFYAELRNVAKGDREARKQSR